MARRPRAMPTRETQKLILDKAIELFNANGSHEVSTNRIAEECGLSRGNLYYHFRTKEEIIQAIFQRISAEMDESWAEDHLHPTMEHMNFMFERMLRLNWKYRFFYRELNTLLRTDARLKILFLDNRKIRLDEVSRFFHALIDEGLMRTPGEPASLDFVLTTSWLISDQWLPQLDLEDRPVNEESIRDGYYLILQLLSPYLTEKAQTAVRNIDWQSARHSAQR